MPVGYQNPLPSNEFLYRDAYEQYVPKYTYEPSYKNNYN